MSRTPAVANMFYPGKSGPLREQLRGFISPASQPRRVMGAISPHAGYLYSGGVSGAVFSRIHIPDLVVLLGPNHRGMGAPVALQASGAWSTPLGEVPIHAEVAQRILEGSSGVIRDDSQAHAMEHSIEVQIPFLQFLNPDVSIVPMAFSRVSCNDCERIGQVLAQVIQEADEEILLVASTDMTHYESRDVARAQDQLAIDRMLQMDPRGLYEVVAREKITMCGVVATTVVLFACLALGAKKTELIEYTTSGDVSGDYDQVVGYAGLIVY